MIRPSPNELERLKKEEFLKRRVRRLKEVRLYSKENASLLRTALKNQKKRVIEKVAKSIQEQIFKEKSDAVRELKEKLDIQYQFFGNAHTEANNKVDLTVEKNKIQLANDMKAEERYKLAMKELMELKRQRELGNYNSLEAKKLALDIEKERAAAIASLPPPVPFYGLLNDDDDSVPRVKICDKTKYNFTESYRDAEYNVLKEPTENVNTNAIDAGTFRQKQIEKLLADHQIEIEEQSVKAYLRGHHALKKQLVQKDYDQLVNDLELISKNEMAKRQRDYYKNEVLTTASTTTGNCVPHNSAMLTFKEKCRERAVESAVLDSLKDITNKISLNQLSEVDDVCDASVQVTGNFTEHNEEINKDSQLEKLYAMIKKQKENATLNSATLTTKTVKRDINSDTFNDQNIMNINETEKEGSSEVVKDNADVIDSELIKERMEIEKDYERIEQRIGTLLNRRVELSEMNNKTFQYSDNNYQNQDQSSLFENQSLYISRIREFQKNALQKLEGQVNLSDIITMQKCLSSLSLSSTIQSESNYFDVPKFSDTIDNEWDKWLLTDYGRYVEDEQEISTNNDSLTTATSNTGSDVPMPPVLPGWVARNLDRYKVDQEEMMSSKSSNSTMTLSLFGNTTASNDQPNSDLHHLNRPNVAEPTAFSPSEPCTRLEQFVKSNSFSSEFAESSAHFLKPSVTSSGTSLNYSSVDGVSLADKADKADSTVGDLIDLDETPKSTDKERSISLSSFKEDEEVDSQDLERTLIDLEITNASTNIVKESLDNQVEREESGINNLKDEYEKFLTGLTKKLSCFTTLSTTEKDGIMLKMNNDDGDYNENNIITEINDVDNTKSDIDLITTGSTDQNVSDRNFPTDLIDPNIDPKKLSESCNNENNNYDTNRTKLKSELTVTSLVSLEPQQDDDEVNTLLSLNKISEENTLHIVKSICDVDENETDNDVISCDIQPDITELDSDDQENIRPKIYSSTMKPGFQVNPRIFDDISSISEETEEMSNEVSSQKQRIFLEYIMTNRDRLNRLMTTSTNNTTATSTNGAMETLNTERSKSEKDDNNSDESTMKMVDSGMVSARDDRSGATAALVTMSGSVTERTALTEELVSLATSRDQPVDTARTTDGYETALGDDETFDTFHTLPEYIPVTKETDDVNQNNLLKESVDLITFESASELDRTAIYVDKNSTDQTNTLSDGTQSLSIFYPGHKPDFISSNFSRLSATDANLNNVASQSDVPSISSSLSCPLLPSNFLKTFLISQPLTNARLIGDIPIEEAILIGADDTTNPIDATTIATDPIIGTNEESIPAYDCNSNNTSKVVEKSDVDISSQSLASFIRNETICKTSSPCKSSQSSEQMSESQFSLSGKNESVNTMTQNAEEMQKQLQQWKKDRLRRVNQHPPVQTQSENRTKNSQDRKNSTIEFRARTEKLWNKLEEVQKQKKSQKLEKQKQENIDRKKEYAEKIRQKQRKKAAASATTTEEKKSR